MADKKLLEESTIRRFMKLAKINENESSLLSEVKSPVTGGSGQVSKGNKKFSAGEGKHKATKKAHSVKEGYEEGMDMPQEGQYEETMHEEDDMGMDLGGGDDFGAEGGDTKTKVEDAVESLKNALNDILDAVGSDKQVEDEEGGEGDEGGMEEPEMELPSDEEEAEEEPVMEKKEAGKKPAFLYKGKDKKGEKEKEEMDENLDEELDESIELVDEELIEALLKRVTDRLMREAKSGSGGSKSHKPKGSTYAPHGAGKGTGYSGSGKTLGNKGAHQAKKR